MRKVILNFPDVINDGDEFACVPVGAPTPIPPDPIPPVPPDPTPPPTGGFYASVLGSSSSDGSIGKPWPLQTALSKPLAAGSTLWLRGGIYKGSYRSNLIGTKAAPIWVRGYPGERATIDSKDFPGKPGLLLGGMWTNFEGFEVMNSNTLRTVPSSVPDPSHPPVELMPSGDGVVNAQESNFGTGCKLIGMVIHDTRQGISAWSNSTEVEVYGCLIFYNGWLASDRSHGYGCYWQNNTGSKVLRNCFILNNCNMGFVFYGSETAFLNNGIVDGNTFAANGSLAGSIDRQVLMGGHVVVKDSIFANNLSYCPARGVGDTLNVGLYQGGAGSRNVVVKLNTLVGGKMAMIDPITGFIFSDNYLATDLVGVPVGTNNKIVSGMPTDTVIFARPNIYRPGRTHLSIVNGAGLPVVSVPAAQVGLVNGNKFSLTAVENPFVIMTSGIVSGGVIPIPMAAGVVLPPSGLPAPPSLRPKLGLFIVDKV